MRTVFVKCILLSLFCFFSEVASFSIENRFKYITAENGLSQSNITAIFQDSQGFMWFGTFNGLNRFDGYKIQVFKSNPEDSLSLSHERITTIIEDKQKRLWIGTLGGGVSVYFMELGIFKRIIEVNSGNETIKLNRIAAIQQTQDGTIWILDEDSGLFILNEEFEILRHLQYKEKELVSLPEGRYFSLLIDHLNICWIGVNSNTLARFAIEGNVIKKFDLNNSAAASDDELNVIYEDKDFQLWIGTTNEGLYSLNRNDGSFQNINTTSEPYSLSRNRIMSICEDWNGNILIATDGGGINILDKATGQIQHILYEASNNQTLNTNSAYFAYLDPKETIWVGTYSGGVNYQNRYQNKFKSYKPDPGNPSSLSYKDVSAVLEDTDGTIWVGTDGGGLNSFDTETEIFTRYKSDLNRPDWLHTNVIIHLMQDSDGDIYLSSYGGGLTILNKKTQRFRQYLPDENKPTGISGLHPWNTFQDSYGAIWVGFLGTGLDLFDKANQTFKHYITNESDPNSLNTNNIKTIYEDSQRTLWIGNEGGSLHKYNRDDDNFTRYLPNPEIPGSISNNDIRAIYDDSRSNFWIGTGDGLNLMDRQTGKFEVFRTDEGLSGNNIDGILEDQAGNLWISTNNGISKFDPSKKTFRNYDVTDGLQGNEFNYTACIKSRNGLMYFGGKNGLTVFNPASIPDNPHAPQIVLTDFQIFNKSIDRIEVRRNGKTVVKSLSATDEIKISYRQNVIGFEFAALDFANPLKNQYKYKLEGFDKDWNTIPSNKRFVTYSNLKGGTYTFRVIASNGDGVWNLDGLKVKLIVTPPLWQRPWFIALSLLALTMAIRQYFRNRNNRIARDKQILHDKIEVGLKEVEKKKEEIAIKNNELEIKLKKEAEQNWLNGGISNFSSLISKNKDNIFKLSQEIANEIHDYLQVPVVAVYLLNDNETDDKHLYLSGIFAPDLNRIPGKRIEINEGQIGACFADNHIIKSNNLPVDYARLISGLGQISLKYLVAIPLKLDEIVIGVIELLAYNPIEEVKINLIEKIGETMASLLTALNANVKTQNILENQKIQAREMSQHQEELRQNLEEMKATQEESERLRHEIALTVEKYKNKENENILIIEKLSTEVENLKMNGKPIQ